MDALTVTGIAVFCRVAGCFMVLPGLSNSGVPVQVRLYMVIGIAVSIAALVPLPATGAASPAALVSLIATETLMGVVLGLLGRFAMFALSFGATAVATVIGYGNIPGTVMEPTEPQAVLGTLVTFSALVVLFQLEFHHEVIRALVASYTLVPVGELPQPGMLLDDMTAVTDRLFRAVLQLIGPFVVYGLLANATIGLVNKLAPQIPIYFVSLPALIFGGLVLLYLVFPTFLMRFGEVFLETYTG